MPYVMQGVALGETPASVPIPGTTLTMTPEEFSLHLYLLVAQLEHMNRIVKATINDPSKSICDPEKFPIGTLAPDIMAAAPIAIPGVAVMVTAASETTAFQEASRHAAVDGCSADARRVLRPAFASLSATALLTQVLLGPDWATLSPSDRTLDAIAAAKAPARFRFLANLGSHMDVPLATSIAGVPKAERLAKGSEIVRRLRLVKPDNALKWYRLAVKAVAFGSKQYDLALRLTRQRVAAQYDWGFAATAASIAGAANDVFLTLLHGAKEAVSFVARTAAEITVAAGSGLLEGLMSALGPLVGIAAAVAGGYLLYRVYKKRKTTTLPAPAPVGAFPMYRR